MVQYLHETWFPVPGKLPASYFPGCTVQRLVVTLSGMTIKIGNEQTNHFVNVHTSASCNSASTVSEAFVRVHWPLYSEAVDEVLQCPGCYR